MGVTTRLSSKEELHTLIPPAVKERLLVVGFTYKVLLQVQVEPYFPGKAMSN